MLKIRLTNSRPDAAHDVIFHPAFTYPIFGEEETIFGYQGLKIELDFTEDTLWPSLNVTSKAKFKPLGDTKPDEVEEPLQEVLPGLTNTKPPQLDVEHWTPPGKLIYSYNVNGQSYGVWTTTLSDPKAKELFRNMQAFVLFFIEGGTIIELDDPDWTIDRWRVFFTYVPAKQVTLRTADILFSYAIHSSPDNPAAYSLVGYCTAYMLWHLAQLSEAPLTPPSESTKQALPEDNPALQHTVPSRSRISQFLILPPYQRGGHGSQLYETVYSFYLAHPQTIEIPVEDPNESFDDMRDTCDLVRLRSNPAFTSLRLNNTSNILPRVKTDKLPTSKLLDSKLTTSIRTASKIIPRQFDRLLEMELLSKIPPRNRNISRLTRKDRASDENDRTYYLWRLLVKQRLYKHNKDSLIQITLAERHEKLDEALNAVEKDYLRLLEMVDKRIARREVARAMEPDATPTSNGTGEGDSKVNGSGSSRGTKRGRIIEEDEDDEEELPRVNGTASKKARIEAEV